jgi:hypothetical protein
MKFTAIPVIGICGLGENGQESGWLSEDCTGRRSSQAEPAAA